MARIGHKTYQGLPLVADWLHLRPHFHPLAFWQVEGLLQAAFEQGQFTQQVDTAGNVSWKVDFQANSVLRVDSHGNQLSAVRMFIQREHLVTFAGYVWLIKTAFVR